MEQDRIGTVLVVDDDVVNVDILEALLAEEYEVSVATDGVSAVAVATDQRPHLILLDILMSGMGGYEVFRILKQDKMTQDIPVIFISSLSGEIEQEEGLSLGAVDYITKPFSPFLVRARVRNHINLRRAQLDVLEQRDTINDAYQKLRELEEQRDDMIHMLLHDLRTPLTTVLGGLDYSLLMLKNPSAAIPELTGILENTKNTGRKLNKMLDTLLDVGRLESRALPLSIRECRLADILQSAFNSIHGLANDHRVSISCEQTGIIYGDFDILERVIINLMMNALQHTPEQGKIFLAASLEKNWIHISVTDTGPGIPPEFHEKIFQKFGRVLVQDAERGSSAGLGLTFCKLAVEAHGGSIHVESLPGKGACFSVRLPRTASLEIVGADGKMLSAVADADLEKMSIVSANLTVFLVSSDRMLLKSLMRYLESSTNWLVTPFQDLARAVRTAMIVRPDIVLLDIDMQQNCEIDIFRDFESVIAARKSTIAYYTELLLPEETQKNGYSLSKGGQPVIPKRLPLAEFLGILVNLMKERNAWLKRRKQS